MWPRGIIDPKGRLSKELNTARDLTPLTSTEVSVPNFHTILKDFEPSQRLIATVYLILKRDALFSCVADFKGTKLLVKQSSNFSNKLKVKEKIELHYSGEKAIVLSISDNCKWELPVFTLFKW
jgi:hypothetical protein